MEVFKSPGELQSFAVHSPVLANLTLREFCRPGDRIAETPIFKAPSQTNRLNLCNVRVNAEQASKSSMRKPTRQRNGEGRRRWYPAWPGLLGKSDSIQRFRRGNGAGMHVDGGQVDHLVSRWGTR